MKDYQGSRISWIEERVADGHREYLAHTRGDDGQFSDLSADEQAIVLRWLDWNLWPSKTECETHTSYGMKHILEYRTGIYMTNNQMKGAMLRLGYLPCNEGEMNWTYKVRKKSPLFQEQKDGRCGMPMLGNPMDYSSWRKDRAKEASDGTVDGTAAASNRVLRRRCSLEAGVAQTEGHRGCVG